MRPPALVLTIALLAAAAGRVADAAPAPIEVTECGQRVPPRTTGFLSADLTCTTGVGAILEQGATLDLRGFTLSGGVVGVACLRAGCTPPTCVTPSRCEVRNGTITATLSGSVAGSRVTIRDMMIDGYGGRGVLGHARVDVIDSRFLNATLGIQARHVRVTGSTLENTPVNATRAWLTSSTVTNNSQIGVIALAVELVDSHVVGNGTAPECSGSLVCGDLVTHRRPKLDAASTCDTSLDTHAFPYQSWGVCTLD